MGISGMAAPERDAVADGAARQDRLLYWWAAHQAPALLAEDCLLSPEQAAWLARVPQAHAGCPWAPSLFLLLLREETPALAALSVAHRDGRRRLLLAALLLALERPHLLGLLPAAGVEAALAPAADGLSELARFARETAAGASLPAGPPITPATCAAALRRAGFDLGKRRFLSRTAAGDRLAPAALPLPQGARVDVQVIGPFGKLSGMGQATRLVAQALEAALTPAGLSLNRVDFDLDNPAPDLPAPDWPASDGTGPLRPARLNVILNADSVPLAYAGLPDVFSQARTVGFFFWEQSRPAASHALGLTLIDELWVASDYGAGIYRPQAACPVHAVGLGYEIPPRVPRAEARAFLRRRFGLGAGDFVLLASFDSLSSLRRKNPLGAIRAFQAAFPGDRHAHLILKTQNLRQLHDPRERDLWAEVAALAAADPRLRLVDALLPRDALLRLMKGADGYLSLHRSEGWGFGMIEAMALGVPVVATGYSGNLAYCSDETAWLVGFREVSLAPDASPLPQGGPRWAEPDQASAVRQLRRLRGDPALRAARRAAALRNLRDNFSPQAIGARYLARVHALLPARGP